MMTRGVTSIVSRRSGRAMPSMPIEKRERITSIQVSSMVNWSWSLRSKSKLNNIHTPTPATASVVTRAMTLWRPSSARGMIIITTAPARGRKVAMARHQSLSRSFMSSLSEVKADRPYPGGRRGSERATARATGTREAGRGASDGEHQDAGQEGGTGEQQGGVLLDPAGLDPAEHAAGLRRSPTGTVDHAVDHLLVEVVVDEVGGVAGDGGGAVDHPVEHLLVE